MSETAANSFVLENLDPDNWQWYHIYHFIMTLDDGIFMEYSQALHYNLHSQNINGNKLDSLTETDWIKLGVHSTAHIQILSDAIAKLRQTTESPNSNKENMTPNTDNPQTETNSSYVLINGGAINNIHSTLYQNELDKHTLTQNCHALYVYAQQINTQLTNERTKHIQTQNVLTQIQTNSFNKEKALNDALVTAYTEQSYMAMNINKLQNMCAEQDTEMENIRTEMEIMSDKYWQCSTDYELLFTEHSQLQQKYNEMRINNDRDSNSDNAQNREKKSVSEWDFNDIYLWILAIDNGYFEKYETLYESLEIEAVNGDSLCECDCDDIHRMGISDVMDQRRLIANVRLLIKDCGESPVSDDTSSLLYDFDFAEIDLFGN